MKSVEHPLSFVVLFITSILIALGFFLFGSLSGTVYGRADAAVVSVVPCALEAQTLVDPATVALSTSPTTFLDPCHTLSLTRSPQTIRSQSAQEQPLVVRVYFADRADLGNLTGELDVWEVHHGQKFVVALVYPTQYEALLALGYRVEIDEGRTASLAHPRRAPEQTAGIPGYACYRTIDETYADLSLLAANHPTLAQWVDIGDSYDKVTPGGSGGYDLQALVLTNRNRSVPKAKFLLLAAVHARELATAELAARFAEKLVAGYGHDADITWLLDYNEIHIVALANPDGRMWAQQGYLWRKNTDRPALCSFPNYGVDLNRNNRFRWNGCTGSGCSSSNPCSVVYRGGSPASEPETQALEAYITALFPDQRGPGINDVAPANTTGLLISLHSYGQMVLYPWDWTTASAPNAVQLRTLGRKLGYYNQYQVCHGAECLYLLDGSHDDFAYGELGIAVYTIELGTDFFQRCGYFESDIVPGNLDALLYAAKAARRPYQVAAGPEVVDVSVAPAAVSVGAIVTVQARADDTRYDSNGWGSEPVQAVAAARYSVDAPAWQSNQTVALAPVDGAFDETSETVAAPVNTVGWSPGRHTIFVESRDLAGNWGVPSAAFVWVDAVYGLDWGLDAATHLAQPGQTLTHTLTVTNTGNSGDVFDVAVVQSDWAIAVPDRIGPLAAGASATLTVGVTVPVTATAGAVNYALLRITSQNDPAQSTVVTLQEVVDVQTPGLGGDSNPPSLYLPWIERP